MIVLFVQSDVKPGFEPQVRQNTKSISSAISSQQISGKNSESKLKHCNEKFSKNLSFGVDFKLKVPPLMYKINTHNISGMRN